VHLKGQLYLERLPEGIGTNIDNKFPVIMNACLCVCVTITIL